MLPALHKVMRVVAWCKQIRPQKQKESTGQRTPPKHANIQYNFCKNPVCSNFGVTPPETFKRGILGSYAITYGGRAFPLLKGFDGGSALIEQWLRNKDTVLFLVGVGTYLQPRF
jgi:hypothetical protein